MAKVLVLGPSFYGYTQSVGKALEKNGFETKVFNWKIENEVFGIINNIEAKILGGREAFIRKKQIKYNRQALHLYRQFKPDYVLVIRGAILHKETLSAMNNTPIILWMMDSIFQLERVLSNIRLFSKIFVFEKEDISRLKAQYNVDAEFMALALDEDVYYPLDIREKPIDILFVGALYPNRVAYLNKIINRFPGKSIKIYGFYFSKIRNLKRFFFRKDKRFYMNKTIKPKQLNKLYNQTKICLNIHHVQSQYGVNQRFFEISGAKALQICDRHGFIDDNFSANEVLIFDTEEELYQIIEKVLNGGIDMKKETLTVYEKVLAKHTFSNRMKQIFGKTN